MKARQSQRMAPLRRVAEGREQQAAQKLAASQQLTRTAAAKLQELRSYLRDYESSRGLLDPDFMSNRQLFITRLREAERYQSGALERAQLAAEQERERWLKQRRDLQVLDKLTQIYRLREHRHEERQVQKQMDERALRQHTQNAGNNPDADEY